MTQEKLKILTSQDILKALEQKHQKDIFIPECKNGSSYGGHLRMDVWVMKPSWASQNSIVYEIKVSRSDFIGDTKYPLYFPYCNEFYFVCPSKMIMPNEIPDICGLMWVSSTGTRIYTKKKAKHRTVEIPEDLYRYILMCRVDICKHYNDYDPTRKKTNSRDFWQAWLRDKKANLKLGHMAGRKLRCMIDEKIDEAERENKRLAERLKSYDDIRALLQKLDINPNGSSWELSCYSVEEKIEKFRSIISPEIEQMISQTIKNLKMLEMKIEKHKGIVRP